MYPAGFVPDPQYSQVQIEQMQPALEYNRTTATVYGDMPVKARCPNCKIVVNTYIERQIGMSTWMVSLALTVFCLVPCNYYPFCMAQCQDAVHHCPKCTLILGKKPLLG